MCPNSSIRPCTSIILQSCIEWRGMLPVDLALRVNNPSAANSLMELRLEALREELDGKRSILHTLDVDESKSRRPELALFSGWDKDHMRCEVFKELMLDENHAKILKSMRREIVRCVCAGGHVRLLEEVIKLLGVKAVDIKKMLYGRSPPLWIAADNGNVDQVARMIECDNKFFYQGNLSKRCGSSSSSEAMVTPSSTILRQTAPPRWPWPSVT